MAYNRDRRPRFSAKFRGMLFALRGGICEECGQLIEPDQPWDVSHSVARELLPNKAADALDNLYLIHSHPMPCHKRRTARDKALIAASNRTIAKLATPASERPAKGWRHTIKPRPFQKRHRPMQSRGFQKRSDR